MSNEALVDLINDDASDLVTLIVTVETYTGPGATDVASKET